MKTAAEAQSRRRLSVLARLAGIDDGAILKGAFYTMLAGTGIVLAMDYMALGEAGGETMPGSSGITEPVLPAVDRPELDPDAPQFRPSEQVRTSHEVLTAPLEIALGPDGVLSLTGTITIGSAQSFAEEVGQRGDYVETISLDSPGGSVEDALAIAALIVDHGFDTRVADGALCASSCPLVLAAGAGRQAGPGASVGVHQIYAAMGDVSAGGAAQAMSDAQVVTARITRYLIDREIDPALWTHALETPPDRLYYLTLEEMRGYRLIDAEDAEAAA
ncbi:hypothetical protein [Pelagibacterium montanilacus]|uniref:COG3904 family protein n=1 Tax=Pelagibacterium montanilacus TaxID=2185280 RepID=UPI000F8C508D|nr:hypothetical protein [Pelagibacterium montanilacus]